jgi:hypothetical protein
MAVPYTFGTATASIPLSQLDSNFATAITLGNTAIQLGNTVTTLNNMTLANVTISSGSFTITNLSATTANVTTANVVTLIVTGNETVQGNTSVTGTATASKFIPTGNSATGNGMYLPATNAVGISTNGTNAVYIDASQNVGIGITSPAAKLVVSNAGAAGMEFFTNAPSGGVGTYIQNYNRSGAAYIDTFYYAASHTWRTNASATSMVLATTGIVTMSYYGVGTATFSAAGVISSVSDETWKIKDGVPVDPDAMLKKLEPGYWYYNDEKKEIFGVDRQLGFYAQNVNSAIGPEAAPTPEEGKPWGYYDRSVLAVTVMSLQKALATIQSLTARIDALEAA